jgi:3D (Asp-Asp-Asp) domain-containing protein
MEMLSRNRKGILLFFSMHTVFLIGLCLYGEWKIQTLTQHQAAAAAEIQMLKAEQRQLQQGYERHKKQLRAKHTEQQKAKAKAKVTLPGNDVIEVEAEPTSSWHSIEMTAYTAFCKEGCTGVTATGLDVSDNSKDYRVVAVDPRVIPLHSVIEIQGHGYFKAMDKGGAIKGYKVDVLMQTHKKAIEFGRQQGKFRFIRKGGPL